MDELTVVSSCPRCSQNPKKTAGDLTPMTYFTGEDDKNYSVCSECGGVFPAPDGFECEEK
jgi:hypothetical protein